MVNWGRMVNRKNWGVVGYMMYWGRMVDRDYRGVVDRRVSNSMSKVGSVMTMRHKSSVVTMMNYMGGNISNWGTFGQSNQRTNIRKSLKIQRYLPSLVS